MANICWFEMRMRGTKANCYAMLNSDIPCYDAYVSAENGTEEDYMMYVRGECRWSVTASMVDVEPTETLAAKAARFQLELEVCGLDESEEVQERFHYKGDQTIKVNNLPSSVPVWMVDDGECELSEEDLLKYNKIEEHNMYVLKEEYMEHFTYDDEQGEAVFEFEMSFADLPGYEEDEEAEAPDGGDLFDSLFGGKQALLSMMGIEPDEDGFAIGFGTDLYAYFGTAKTVVVPEGVEELEPGCFSDNDTVEEIILPETLEAICEDCFENCPNLKKVVIPANVESMFDDDDSFAGCPNLTIYTPAGSVADRVARAKNIPVVND